MDWCRADRILNLGEEEKCCLHRRGTIRMYESAAWGCCVCVGLGADGWCWGRRGLRFRDEDDDGDTKISAWKPVSIRSPRTKQGTSYNCTRTHTHKHTQLYPNPIYNKCTHDDDNIVKNKWIKDPPLVLSHGDGKKLENVIRSRLCVVRRGAVVLQHRGTGNFRDTVCASLSEGCFITAWI